jgi:hypothetical protein
MEEGPPQPRRSSRTRLAIERSLSDDEASSAAPLLAQRKEKRRQNDRNRNKKEKQLLKVCLNQTSLPCKTLIVD